MPEKARPLRAYLHGAGVGPDQAWLAVIVEEAGGRDTLSTCLFGHKHCVYSACSHT